MSEWSPLIILKNYHKVFMFHILIGHIKYMTPIDFVKPPAISYVTVVFPSNVFTCALFQIKYELCDFLSAFVYIFQ
jgi:hypothetical protein